MQVDLFEKVKSRTAELQMPVVQNAVCIHLEKQKNRFLVGIVSFEEQFIGLHEYTESEISQAHKELETIFKQMGY